MTRITRGTTNVFADLGYPDAEWKFPRTTLFRTRRIDAERLDHYHRLERERIHLLLFDEAGKGLDDVAAGRVKDARGAMQLIKRRRSA